MIDTLLSSLVSVFAPVHFAMLLLGVILGLSIGVVPGIGGIVAIALLFPFTLKMEAANAIPLIIGVVSVTVTGDTITCVLFGTPGTAGSQATILDGFPMAKKGEAGKALGAAFTVSGIGGVLGALVLTASVPIFRPLVALLSSPEFLAMGLLAISMTAVLSGRYLLRGIIAGGLGLVIALIGQYPILSVGRWHFGLPYLVGGISIVPMALGFFAIPELVDLCVRGTQIVEEPKKALKGKLSGAREALRHKKLIAISSGIGVGIGIIPGMGTVVANWVSYAWALMICKPRHTFGKGDIRGVIAPESANNASIGGALVPTLAFGIPGSSMMALLLFAFMIHGITPGQALLRNPDLVYLIVWALAVANIIGAGICFALTDYLAMITKMRIHVISPLIFVTIFAGSLITTLHIGDIIVLLVFGILGWVMKHLDWPRPPLVVGFVLAPMLERFYFKSMMIYGFTWLIRPLTLGIIVLAIIVTYFSLRLLRKSEAEIGRRTE